MTNIKDLDLAQLEDALAKWGQPSFRAKQIFAWVYQNKAKAFSDMTDLPSGLRDKLSAQYALSELKLETSLTSKDGTRKFLFCAPSGAYIESACIPAASRLTACVSTQLGCKFSCAFCASGALGYKGDLCKGQILDQLTCMNNSLEGKGITHVVFMGTGEPFDNYDNTLAAVRTINAKWGMNIGARRITISSSGIIPGIKKLAKENLQVELSVSLHAADNRTRDKIMPVNRKYPLEELIKACRDYITQTGRQVTFEYVLLKGLNSDLLNAQKLGRMLRGMNCKINLIPYNCTFPEKFEPPQYSEVSAFSKALESLGINVTIRRSRGQDILAACGQLRIKYETSRV